MSENHPEISEYRNFNHKKILFSAVCIAVCIITLGVGVVSGKYNIGFFECYEVLWNHITGNVATDSVSQMKDYVIWDLRLPISLAGLFVGAGLGVAGAVMQSSMKNPLADPYTTGISSGASLGATLAIIAGITIIPGLGSTTRTVVNAFLFSLIPAFAMIVISSMKRSISPAMMILIGVAVMYMFSATDTLLKVTATEEKLAEAYIWGIGTLGRANWDNIPLIAAASILGVSFFTVCSKILNVLALGDNGVKALGENPKTMRLMFMIVVSMMTATFVCFTGTIGFVGLVAPHIVRMILGSDNRYLIPASACFGAAFLMAADCLARELTASGLPVGVITSLIGGPLFLFILIKLRKNSW